MKKKIQHSSNLPTISTMPQINPQYCTKRAIVLVSTISRHVRNERQRNVNIDLRLKLGKSSVGIRVNGDGVGREKMMSLMMLTSLITKSLSNEEH